MEDRTTDSADEAGEQKMLFMQEQMTQFVEGYGMPLIEVSLVVAKSLRHLVQRLQEIAEESGEELPERLTSPIPIESHSAESTSAASLERLLASVDEDRMDILETIIRISIESKRMTLVDATLLLREWERTARQRLARVQRPGEMFSPFEIEEGF